MARRQWRAALRHLGVYMASITVGVAALVALHSFRNDVVRSIQAENRTLLGGDVRLGANRPLPDSVTAIVDSLVAGGAEAARVTGLLSMALAEENGRTRLVQLRGVEPGFPYHGRVTTDPPGLWGELARGGVLVDPALLAQMNIGRGDVLRLGNADFVVAGTVAGLPTDVGFQTATGPRVFVALEQLSATGLLGTGSLSRHNVYLRLPDGADPDEIEETHETVLRATRVSFRTPQEHARSLTRSTDFFADYLGLIGLAALLLGGIGVGSAVNVFVRANLPPSRYCAVWGRHAARCSPLTPCSRSGWGFSVPCSGWRRGSRRSASSLSSSAICCLSRSSHPSPPARSCSGLR